MEGALQLELVFESETRLHAGGLVQREELLFGVLVEACGRR